MNRRRIINLLLGFATIVLLVDAVVGEKGFMERMRARRAYAQAAAQLQTIRHQNGQLREDIRRLNEDPAAIESTARKELGLIRPGEVLFIIHNVKPAVEHASRVK